MTEGSSGDVLTGHCPTCGHRIQADALYCTSCGVPVLPPPKRRPLFVDEVDEVDGSGPAVAAPIAPPPPTPVAAPVPMLEPAPPVETYASDGRAPFFANAEVAPPRKRGRGLPILLALVVIAAAGAVGFTLGRDDHTPPTAGSDGHPSTTPSASPSTHPSLDSSAPPHEQLLRISRTDTPAASRLIGTWVPQLAAISSGIGGDAGWSDALAHYQRLKTSYPDVLLLDTGEWPSTYTRSGMYAVIVPLPNSTSTPVLEWCVEHGLAKHDCAAKHIDTEGDPDNNFDAQ